MTVQKKPHLSFVPDKRKSIRQELRITGHYQAILMLSEPIFPTRHLHSNVGSLILMNGAGLCRYWVLVGLKTFIEMRYIIK
jgi:hypothetical protein